MKHTEENLEQREWLAAELAFLDQQLEDPPTVTTDFIIGADGRPCIKLENSAGQVAIYGFTTGEDGGPRLEMITPF